MPLRFRLNLEPLEPPLRLDFLYSVTEAVVDAMTTQFPDEYGFEQRFDWEYPPWMNLKKHSVEIQESCQMGVLTIWRGDYRGLRIKVIPRNPAVKEIEVRVVSFSPKIDSWLESIQKHFGKYFFVIKPIYFLYAALVFPLVLARTALALRWRGDAVAALKALDSVWITLASQWQGFSAPARMQPQAMGYFLALVAVSGAMVTCILAVIRWVEQGVWSAVLTVLAMLLGVVCIALLAGLVMSLMGFESEV